MGPQGHQPAGEAGGAAALRGWREAWQDRPALGLSMSTVATIPETGTRSVRVPWAATQQAASRLMRSRSLVMENMEWLLSMWTEDQNQCDMPIRVVLIQEKARSLFEDLKREQGEGAESETLRASHGWFAHFKARRGLHGLG